MLDILNIIAPVFLIISLGYLCGRINFLGKEAVPMLNRLIYYIFLPAIIFSLTSQADPADLARFDFVALFMLGSLLTILTCVPGLLFFKAKDKREKTVFLLASTLGNTGYMGIPILIGLYGQVGGVAAITGTIMVNTPLSITAVCLLSMFGDNKASVWKHISKLAKNPFVLSSTIGVFCAFAGLHPPLFISKGVDLLSSPTIALALFTIGLSLADLKPAKETIAEACWISLMKLLISPLIVLALFPLFPEMDPIWKVCAVILAATPVASNNYVIASSANVYVQECVTTILFSTTASIVTLCLFIHYLH